MGARHEALVFAAGSALVDLGWVLVAGDGGAMVKGASAEPAVENFAVGQLPQFLHFFF
jgi:hypothetical protein